MAASTTNTSRRTSSNPFSPLASDSSQESTGTIGAPNSRSANVDGGNLNQVSIDTSDASSIVINNSNGSPASATNESNQSSGGTLIDAAQVATPSSQESWFQSRLAPGVRGLFANIKALDTEALPPRLLFVKPDGTGTWKTTPTGYLSKVHKNLGGDETTPTSDLIFAELRALWEHHNLNNWDVLMVYNLQDEPIVHGLQPLVTAQLAPIVQRERWKPGLLQFTGSVAGAIILHLAVLRNIRKFDGTLHRYVSRLGLPPPTMDVTLDRDALYLAVDLVWEAMPTRAQLEMGKEQLTTLVIDLYAPMDEPDDNSGATAVVDDTSIGQATTLDSVDDGALVQSIRSQTGDSPLSQGVPATGEDGMETMGNTIVDESSKGQSQQPLSKHDITGQQQQPVAIADASVKSNHATVKEPISSSSPQPTEVTTNCSIEKATVEGTINLLVLSGSSHQYQQLLPQGNIKPASGSQGSNSNIQSKVAIPAASVCSTAASSNSSGSINPHQQPDLLFPDKMPPGLESHLLGKWNINPAMQRVWEPYDQPLTQEQLPRNVSMDPDHWFKRMQPGNMYLTLDGLTVGPDDPRHPHHRQHMARQARNVDRSVQRNPLQYTPVPAPHPWHNSHSLGMGSTAHGLPLAGMPTLHFTTQTGTPANASSPWIAPGAGGQQPSGAGGGGFSGFPRGPHGSGQSGPPTGPPYNSRWNFSNGGSNGGGSGGGGDGSPGPHGHGVFPGSCPPTKPWQSKPDASSYRRLTEDGQHSLWDEHTQATLHAQNLGQITDPHYELLDHVDAENDVKKNAWVYAMLLEKVDTHVGKAIIAAHRHDRDARQILVELRQNATISAAGRLRIQQTHTLIITTHLDSTYKGSQTQFLTEFHTRLKRYNDVAPDSMKINDDQAKMYLQAAVRPAPNLHNVSVREVEHMAVHNQPAHNYGAYMQVLMTAATTHDLKGKRTMQACHSGLEPVNSGQDDGTEDVGTPSLEINAADTKRPLLPSSVYSSLSNEGKRQWRTGFTDTDKETILAGMIQANMHAMAAPDHEEDPPMPEDDAPEVGELQANQAKSSPAPKLAPPDASRDALLGQAHAADPRWMLADSKPKDPAKRQANAARQAPAAPTIQAHMVRFQHSLEDYWDDSDDDSSSDYEPDF